MTDQNIRKRLKEIRQFHIKIREMAEERALKGITPPNTTALQDRAPSSVNVTGTDRKIGTRLTHACSRSVRRQLLTLATVHGQSSDYCRVI